ncbi:unnamed protein product [Trifolium pratense]|uniref:Uncharacterized protein n=1 Tax=Trifolium pratense TaxID=57577 RepID=A0ACB0M2S0_TRIPR|nr:unnamed protein product [Trifolium pratense]
MALFYFLVFISLCIACCKVDARSKALLNEQNHFTASDNTMLQVDNDFECVDIYKQPALQHPLLKNHKIQLYPTFAKNVVRSRPSYDRECPRGKVPIYKRTKRHQIVTNSSSKLPIEDLRHYANRFNEAHTVTLDTSQNQIFYGGSALISAYNLSLNLNQYSTSSVIVESGPRAELNSIHAGVGVRPDIYHDSQLRLTSYWTDRSTGNWWLIIDEKKEIHVGYWPKEIFTHLSNGASKVRFGGETAAITVSPPMGSGRLPQDGFQYSALMGLLQHIDTNYNQIDLYPALVKVYNDAKKECYDLKFYEALGGKLYRRAILYGGPGGQCNL